jgi:hypothetical protein
VAPLLWYLNALKWLINLCSNILHTTAQRFLNRKVSS